MKEIIPRAVKESPLNVENRNGGFVYRWVTKKKVDFRKSQGWQVVTKVNDKVIPNFDTNSENPIMHKTLVLMRMPEKKYKKRREKINLRINEQIEAIRAKEREVAARSGVKII